MYTVLRKSTGFYSSPLALLSARFSLDNPVSVGVDLVQWHHVCRTIQSPFTCRKSTGKSHWGQNAEHLSVSHYWHCDAVTWQTLRGHNTRFIFSTSKRVNPMSTETHWAWPIFPPTSYSELFSGVTWLGLPQDSNSSPLLSLGTGNRRLFQASPDTASHICHSAWKGF